jgi:hypothetical protein
MGGKATLKTGECSEKIKLNGFTDTQYTEFKHDLIELIQDFNEKYKTFAGEPLWTDNNEIVNYDIFSGSGNAFFKKNRDEYIKVKPIIGDLDVQVPDKNREKLKEFLENSCGAMFGKFKYIGTKYGLDFYNVFQAPKKFNPHATNIQIDFEFNEYEDGKPNQFDLWAKNSDWSDLQKGIKGVAKQELLPCLYKIKYKRTGILLQPKSDIPAKNQRGGNFNSLSLGPKGSRGHYVPVMKNGKQLIVNGQLAYRETSVKDTGTNKNLDTIFEELFDHKPNSKEKKLFWSYQGCLQLMKENYSDQMIKEIYQLYSKHMLDHTDNEDVYNTIMKKFEEYFPYVNMNFEKYVKQITGE